MYPHNTRVVEIDPKNEYDDPPSNGLYCGCGGFSLVLLVLFLQRHTTYGMSEFLDEGLLPVLDVCSITVSALLSFQLDHNSPMSTPVWIVCSSGHTTCFLEIIVPVSTDFPSLTMSPNSRPIRTPHYTRVDANIVTQYMAASFEDAGGT